jgi:hypothetical protein
MKGWCCREINERRKEVVVVPSLVYLAKETKSNEIPIPGICVFFISLN